MSPLPPLTDSVTGLLGHAENRYVFLIGGGGKTTLMFALARSLCRTGNTVVTTTSTRILRPSPEDSPAVVVDQDLARLVPLLRDRLRDAAHVTAARTALADGEKLSGFSADELDRLHEARVADYLLVEADGAAGRSLKAHHEHEPVVSPRADLVIAVIGIDCLAKPMTDEHVHRASRFGGLLGCELGAPITVDDIARILFAPRGYLHTVGPQTEVAVFISKVKSSEDRRNAERLAGALCLSPTPGRDGAPAGALQDRDDAGRITRIAVGDLVGSSAFLEILNHSP
ncbi:MAG: putative selenium-dependent hydroxylase accessory protein YqeC [bacterium]|nr:putative selenium-dependent hydroxylase accessory protein YqeC [bacterium]